MIKPLLDAHEQIGDQQCVTDIPELPLLGFNLQVAPQGLQVFTACCRCNDRIIRTIHHQHTGGFWKTCRQARGVDQALKILSQAIPTSLAEALLFQSRWQSAHLSGLRGSFQEGPQHRGLTWTSDRFLHTPKASAQRPPFRPLWNKSPKAGEQH